MIALAMFDFALAGINVALALWDGNSVSFVNWVAAAVCFGIGIKAAVGDRG